MTTVLQYLVIAALVAIVLFGVALLVFGRGEQLSALPARTSPAELPDAGISGSDVRGVRFALALRGYRMSDVDWTLERLADELDRTRARIALLDPNDDTVDADGNLVDPLGGSVEGSPGSSGGGSVDGSMGTDLFADPGAEPALFDPVTGDPASPDASSHDAIPDGAVLDRVTAEDSAAGATIAERPERADPANEGVIEEERQ